MMYEDLIHDYVLNKDLNPEFAKASLQQMEEWEFTHPKDAGKHFYYVAQFHYEQGDLENCMDFAIKGIRALISKPYTLELVKCYNLIGVVYDQKGNNKLQALDYYLEALDIALRNHDDKTASAIYNNIGCLYDSLHDVENSIYYLLKAFSYFKQDKGDEVYMLEALNLSLMYCEVNDWDQVYEYYHLATQCENKGALHGNQTHLLVIQCLIAHHQKNHAEVRQKIQELCILAKEQRIFVSGFIEILRQLPKFLDCRYHKELSELLHILYELSQRLDLPNAELMVYENAIEYCKILNLKEKVTSLSYQYYELSRASIENNRKMLIDGVNVKLQMRSLVQEHQAMETLSRSYKEQAERDGLTRLYNRTFMKTTLEPKFAKIAKKQKSIGLLIMDVNDFKPYNDCYGHVAGDFCIREIGEILLRHCDHKSYFVRYGGDEFLGVFFHQNAQNINNLIQLIYAEVKALNIPHAAATTIEKYITVTIGAYVAVPKEGEDLYDFIRCADRQLYIGKSQDKTIQIQIED